MQLQCPQCKHTLVFEGERPRFCSQCGQPLSTSPDVSVDSPTITSNPEPVGSTVTRITSTAGVGREFVEGDVVGGYRLIRRLGAGAMGCVFEAEHRNTSRRVAIKLIAPDIALSPTAVERFRVEGRLASLIAHPRCVFVLEADEIDGQPFIVMELMPGTTLSAVVQKDGPLPPIDAIHKILDVIDGLREAHKIGVIHRDVKPSNCFVDDKGRVKVGDFGLAKAVDQTEELTHQGAFVGTVSYSSPEQIKRLPLDVQSDVYSVCATLYFLLTGRPPFGGGDPLAVATRIVTEDAPSMRTFRPEIPVALDRVVQRGLERDKSKRWSDLDTLRAALVSLLPGQVSAASLWPRILAGASDLFLLGIVSIPADLVLHRLDDRHSSPDLLTHVGIMFVQWLLWLAYFGVPETIWGVTPGKALFRLRVESVGDLAQPSFRQLLIRTSVFYFLFNLVSIVEPFGSQLGLDSVDPSPPMSTLLSPQTILSAVTLILGLGLIVSTMRPRNGYRGLHEWLSGTRVTQAPWRRRSRGVQRDNFDLPTVSRGDMPIQVGRFRICGVLVAQDDYRVLLADDPALGRRVWITMTRKRLSESKRRSRDVTRLSRLRWVSAGSHEGWQWDAWLAPAGRPITETIASGRILWHEVAPILEELAHELTVSVEEGSLPRPLHVDQVWVGSDNRVQLVHFPWRPLGQTQQVGDSDGFRLSQTEESRALELLRQVAQCLLEGKVRSDGPQRILAPLPQKVASALERLFPGPKQWSGPRAFRDELRRLALLPDEVTRRCRIIQILALAIPLVPMSVVLFSLNVFLEPIVDVGWAALWSHRAEHFDRVTRAELAAGLANPLWTSRLTALAQWHADRVRLNEIQQIADRAQMRRNHQLEGLPSPIRRGLLRIEEIIRDSVSDDVIELAELRAQRLDHQFEDFRGIQRFSLFVLPLLWLFSTWIFRGGWSLWIAGINLVQADGRPASRIMAMARGLLFWLPFWAIWWSAHFMQTHYWSGGESVAHHERFSWMLRVSHGLWWAGLALWLVYIALALRQPKRGPHDRIVGTWLVPR